MEVMLVEHRPGQVSVLFSEPKISQFSYHIPLTEAEAGFSALQRAENFSIAGAGVYDDSRIKFQCSSASRKFLNQE